MTYPQKLRLGAFYHIYSQGNNGETLFRQQRNYRYFLHLYAHHMTPVVFTYAYCLLPNHFHFFIRTKTAEEQIRKGKEPRQPSKHVSNLLNAYSRAFNNMFQRSGALFKRPFGRKPVGSPAHFNNLIVYIHRNAQHHGLIEDFRDWPFSSYSAFTTENPSRLQRSEVLAWFDSRATLVDAHTVDVIADDIGHLLSEDLE
ncbi:MAG: hypothetical protein GY759_18850 [Chloroflexi bacterium]|nr:hypothetical protein [Chloroflexota bacterium]